MAVTLRLMRFGKKHYPTYRIVAIDKRKKRDGSYIDKVGTYNPMREPAEVDIDQERFKYWKNNGAEISEGVRKILKKINSDKEASSKPKAKKETGTAKKTSTTKSQKSAK
ncbi:MAG: 30S ribosomal protein S16 [Patescibacteria group bacterium]